MRIRRKGESHVFVDFTVSNELLLILLFLISKLILLFLKNLYNRREPATGVPVEFIVSEKM